MWDEHRKSFRSSLSRKAGGFQRQRLWSPVATGEIPQRSSKRRKGFRKTLAGGFPKCEAHNPTTFREEPKKINDGRLRLDPTPSAAMAVGVYVPGIMIISAIRRRRGIRREGIALRAVRVSGGDLCRRQKHRPSRQARILRNRATSYAFGGETGRSALNAFIIKPRQRGVEGADCRWQSLPQAEAPTEPGGETAAPYGIPPPKA